MSNHKNTLKTAWNDVTGDTINNSLKSDNKKYADGWDAIFGKKKEEPPVKTEAELDAEIELYNSHPDRYEDGE